MRRFIFILDCTEHIAQTPGNLPQKWTHFLSKSIKFISGKELFFKVNVWEDSSLFLTALSTLLRHLEICLKNGPFFCQKVPNSQVANNSFFKVNLWEDSSLCLTAAHWAHCSDTWKFASKMDPFFVKECQIQKWQRTIF